MYVAVVISVYVKCNRHADEKYLVEAKIPRTYCNGEGGVMFSLQLYEFELSLRYVRPYDANMMLTAIL